MSDAPIHFQVVGCNHHSTPLEIREQIALTPEALDRLRKALAEDSQLLESYVLHTCNRLEIYAAGEPSSTAERLQSHLLAATGFTADTLAQYTYLHTEQQAIRHLFEVASGLDSQLIGETEILGQVKTAYAESVHSRLVGKTLHRVLQKTLQAAKWARTHTAIGQGQVSLGNVAVELAERIFGKLGKARTLVVGSGEIGREVARALHSRGASAIAVTSRRLENATTLAREVEGETIPFASWTEKLRFVDIAIFATSAPGTILTLESIEALMEIRGDEPLFLVDLAVPRDVDPRIGEMESVFLYNFEDLAEIANRNRALREAEVTRCQKMLADRAEALWASLNGEE